MTTSLCELPFDIFFSIISNLQVDDAVHLGQTCQQFRVVLDEPTICRRVLGVRLTRCQHKWLADRSSQTVSHTEEARQALEKKITYKEALQAIYDRRHALSNAAPFAARILGHGSSFLCRQGVICVLQGDHIEVSRVHSPPEAFRFSLTKVLQPNAPGSTSLLGHYRFSLLYYSDDVLSLLVEGTNRVNGPFIVAVSTAACPPAAGRVLKLIHLEESSKVFVRHTSRFLYYGTHTGLGDDGHHKWEIFGKSFDEKNDPLPEVEEPVLLQNFHGTDIGSTIAFEIHNDHFYAVSNQGTFEVEEVDWTSFYHCLCFRLDDPDPEKVKKNERVFRRQHAQGPIHDSWTDLSLQVSEETGKMMILESRREWAKASSRQSRTFYATTFNHDKNSSNDDPMSLDGSFDKALLPENDIYVGVLDSTNKPNYMPTPAIHSWSRHPEFEDDARSPRTFTLSRTKFRAYNYSCTSFLDLVEDDQCCAEASKPPCLRLRIGSRRETSPTSALTLSKGKARIDSSATFNDFEDKHTAYRHSPIRMFPPSAAACPCSKRLHDIMNPAFPVGSNTLSRSVTGVLDERSLVYMVKPGRSYGASTEETQGTIVVVNFTRDWDQARLQGSAPMLSTEAMLLTSTTSPMSTAHATSIVNTPVTRIDRAMDVCKGPCGTSPSLDKQCWRWSQGQRKRCQTKTCQ